ncbi:MAG: tRNA (adenosine(37)-N6)-threonylcarbamoyltransferase complex dimerization subunit type 1 TsaB [bacterium]
MQKQSKTLFIDTATKFVFLALVEAGVKTESVYQEGINNHSVTIMPLLADMLGHRGIALKDLTEIVVGIGPGSYTGVRIGVSIAKMVGYLNQIPIMTISSLALLASGAASGDVVAFIDARHGNAFMACYRINGDIMEEICADTLANAEAFQASIPGHPIVRESGEPDVLKILHSKLAKPVTDVHALVPNYLQITEAERKRVDA